MEQLDYYLDQMKMGRMEMITNAVFCAEISNIACMLIRNAEWNNKQIHMADTILKMANIAYNNTSADISLLDDGIYDELLVMYKRYDPNYQVGSYITPYQEIPQNEIIDKKVMCTIISDKDMEEKLYIKDIWMQNTPVMQIRNQELLPEGKPITKRLINTQHKYPELVGTLDKCKFVLNNDAIIAGVFDKPSVQVFERDYIHKCLSMNVIAPNEIFEMVGELKYDGVSVEAEVCGDTIISALSRGDTADNIASDLTPILGGYKFPYAVNVPTDFKFGIKFEAVITKMDMDTISRIRGKSYKNCRNAIIGIFGASDAYRFVNYITLIPLSTSLDMERIDELNFLNAYYNSGEYNRYVTFKGTYQEILFHVKQFTESAECIRPTLPYMIDGVVLSFIDKNKIEALGRVNSVNKYQMAIKFNPRKVRTNFIGYTYSIGKSGDIIPMVHFKPCEFIGGIHTKQTIHSYARFKELNLAIGDQIDIEYINDVITYVTKPDTEFNRNNQNPPEQFIKYCPCCNSPIKISDSGKSAKCPNVTCHERSIMRMVDMLDRFGFKDFSEETVRALDLTSVKDLIDILNNGKADILGPLQSKQFKDKIIDLLNDPIEDYKLMSALSFDGMAEEKWKLILKQCTINILVEMWGIGVLDDLTDIPGIGPKIVESIDNGIGTYYDDLKYLLSNCTILDSKFFEELPKIAITGFRDPEFVNLLNHNGFDCSDKYGVTKNITALITSDINSTSGKMGTAKKYGIPIYTKDEFIKLNNIIL